VNVSPKAPPQTDHSSEPPIWRRFYEEADRRSAEVRAELGDRAVLDVSYGDDPRHFMDVYLPPAELRTGEIFVFLHGGALESGHPRHYGYLAPAFVSRGAIFIAPAYRLLAPSIAQERERLQQAFGVKVHALGDDAPNELKAVRRASADTAADAAADADAVVDWLVAEAGARWGAAPERVFVGGHSSGAMLSLTSACRAGSPVQGMVPIGGRYGMLQGVALLAGSDPIRPAQEWNLPRVPEKAVIVFSEAEADGDEDGTEDPERLGDCARIGRAAAQALSERGCAVTVTALGAMGHWQTVSTVGDPSSASARATFSMMGLEV
jgi:hypothetical protein